MPINFDLDKDSQPQLGSECMPMIFDLEEDNELQLDSDYLPRIVELDEEEDELPPGSDVIIDLDEADNKALPAISAGSNIAPAKKRIRCEHCGELLLKKALQRHIRRKHGNGDDRVPCELCSKTFEGRDTLQRHEKEQQIGNVRNNIVCQRCRATVRRRALNEHRRSQACRGSRPAGGYARFKRSENGLLPLGVRPFISPLAMIDPLIATFYLELNVSKAIDEAELRDPLRDAPCSELERWYTLKDFTHTEVVTILAFRGLVSNQMIKMRQLNTSRDRPTARAPSDAELPMFLVAYFMAYLDEIIYGYDSAETWCHRRWMERSGFGRRPELNFDKPHWTDILPKACRMIIDVDEHIKFYVFRKARDTQNIG